MKRGKHQTGTSKRFKNNSAVGDVEQTRHVTLTVHKFIQDGGRCR